MNDNTDEKPTERLECPHCGTWFLCEDGMVVTIDHFTQCPALEDSGE